MPFLFFEDWEIGIYLELGICDLKFLQIWRYLKLKIYIGADHRGFKIKKDLIKLLKKKNYDVMDVGIYKDKVTCDYPKIAYEVANKVAKSKNKKGILICMTGIGHVIAANKVCGAYAALCYNAESAKLSRQHNNSNILVVGAKAVKPKELKKIIKIWLRTEFEGDRHLRRFNKIKKIEKGLCK